MALTRKDIAATLFTGLAVLIFAVTYQGWNVPLIGDSHRWAAGAILLVGMGACGQGAHEKTASRTLTTILGVAAAVLVVWAFATGSLTPLSLLVIDMVMLWALSTFEHVRHAPNRPITT